MAFYYKHFVSFVEHGREAVNHKRREAENHDTNG